MENNLPTKGQVKRFNRRQSHYSSVQSKQELMEQTPVYANYDYSNWRMIWRAIRHAMIGEVEIKRHGEEYLPRPDGMDDEQYSAYLERAVFYNMVYRTVTGLTGAIFRRDARLLNAGDRLKEAMKRISKDGLSLNVFSKVAAQEMLSVGRYGVLVDKGLSDGPNVRPYLAGYTCENILDWTMADIDGRNEYDYILLREFVTDRRLFVLEGNDAKPNTTYGKLLITYRILRLVFDEELNRYVYEQSVYQADGRDASLEQEPVTVRPLVFGVPMDRIPFRFYNATTNLPDVEKPPILDILTLNISHYKSYAQLEHGRFYTANPVYFVSGAQEDDEYHIGPSVVWEIGKEERAGILEFNGGGLKSLENALEQKESQVASLGGRLIGESNTAGQSDNQTMLKDRNEASLLLNVTTVINENFTDLLIILSNWMNEVADDDLEFRVNQDFLLDQAAAREFRAVTMMYQAGILPIEVIYEYFLKADVIPEYVTKEVFVNMLRDEQQFPNNPDFDARIDGFPDARTKKSDELSRDLDDNETERDQMDLETRERIAREARAASQRQQRESNANNNPENDVPPVPPQGQQALTRDS